jgi:outer membrane protein assembly factor BamB
VLHAIAADGSERFRVNLSAALPAGGTAEGRGQTSLTADGTVVQGVRVGATEGAVIAVAPNGEVQWVFESPPVDEGVIATEDGIFFGAGDGRLYALDATGSRMWSREPLVGDGLEVRCLPALLSNGQVAVCDKSGSLRAFETPDGESAWEHSMRTESGPTTVLGGGVAAGPEGDLFVGDVLGIVHGFASDGSRRFEFAVPGIAEESIRARPALSDDTLFVGATNQRLYALWRLDRKRPDDAETP